MLAKTIREKMPLTVSEMVQVAREYEVSVVDVVLLEEEERTGLGREEILQKVLEEYEHNIKAAKIGAKDGESILFGTIGEQLSKVEGAKLFEDKLLDDAIFYTLSAQVGNHCIGLRPCAGTGDSCPHTGFVMAMKENGYSDEDVAKIGALMIKIGGLFRVGKTGSGCNMEGFGSGSVSIAAAMSALLGGTPEDMERAMVIAISPTIAVPCTPRVLVPALCSTHIAGAVMGGMFAAKLCKRTDMEVNVPFDVIFAMASEVHKESATYVVPTVVEFMEPFFRRKENVETLVEEEVKNKEKQHIQDTLAKANRIAKKIAEGSAPITGTLGDPVVGGSSQAVGSPTNAARIAHELAEGKIKAVRVELYPELFARRAINMPGILMGAVYGASTADYDAYNTSVNKVIEEGIQVDIIEGTEPSIQKITIVTDEMTAEVYALNRGGGRLVLKDAIPSLEQAQEAAKRLGIVVVEEE